MIWPRFLKALLSSLLGMEEHNKTAQTILAVDSDHDFLNWVAKHLQVPGEVEVLSCDNAQKAVKVVQKTQVDVILSNFTLQPFDGLELLRQAKASDKNVVSILYTNSPSTSQIIDATQNGARDILRKESMPFELRNSAESALQFSESLRSSAEKKTDMPKLDGRVKMIGVSKPIQDVFKIIGRVAQSEAPVLIIGESGTGKELVAHAIHEYSPRRKNEMVALNCGAIPDNLLESELFGHEKGSFTGAHARRIGRFEQSDQSTLFLDEIGDMPHSVQVKLLRILQEGTFSRVGSNETLKTDVRIIAATNKDLSTEVAEGRFREDLYYRLNVIDIQLPPLRERLDDIPVLAEFFLQRITRKQGMAQIKLSEQAIESLKLHNWPGNVRELENTIARACALSATDLLLPEDIPFTKSAFENDAKIRESLTTLLLKAPKDNGNVLKWVQDALIDIVIKENEGDLKEAANSLGITAAELKALR